MPPCHTPVFSESLLIDGAVLHITPNLASALRRFRTMSCLRWIWADAVCINQHDAAEKALQIPLMAQIYREASRVVAWLGDRPDDVALVRAVRAASRRLRARQPRLNFTMEEYLAVCADLKQLVELPWFTRRWIVQKLMLNLCVSFWCGHFELS
jgi:hypothetical protein